MPDILSDLSALQGWVKDQLFKHAPDPSQGGATTFKPPELPAASPAEGNPFTRMVKGVAQHPIDSISAIGRATTPSDTAGTAASPLISPKIYTPGLPTSSEDTLPTLRGTAAPEEAYGSLNPFKRGALSNIGSSLVPDAAKKAFDEAQAGAKSAQIDAAGRKVSDDAATLLPYAIAGGKALYDLSPAENWFNALRGTVPDPKTGEERPATGPEILEQFEIAGMKTTALKAAEVKIPSLEELLGGSKEANIDPIIKKTRFQGEISSAAEARARNQAEAKAARDTQNAVMRGREMHGPDTDITSGSAPVPLDERGVARAQDIADSFDQAHQITASTVLRAQQTAEPLRQKFEQAVMVNDARWDAMHKGALEGQPTGLAERAVQATAEANPDLPIFGKAPISRDVGESWNQFTNRVDDAASSALTAVERNPEAIHVYYTHSDVIKYLASHAEGDPSPAGMMARDAGAPGSVFRYTRTAEGKPMLVDVTNEPVKGPGAFIVRHGETPWDPPDQPSSNTVAQQATIPPALSNIEQLRQRLPGWKQDQYLTRLPAVSWIQDRIGEWAFAPAALEFMKDYDPANKDTDPVHQAIGMLHADPDFQGAAVKDMEDHHGLSPQESRQLVSSEIEHSAQYAGQTNKAFADAVSTVQDRIYGDALKARTTAEAIEANKTLKVVADFKKKLAVGNAGNWAKVNNVLGNVENLSRSLLVGAFDTAVNIAKSHGLISLGDGADAIHSSLINLVTNSGKNLVKAIADRKMPDVPLGDSFRKDIGDGVSFLEAFTSRIPFVPDVLAGKVHYDPSVYGITGDTYNAIRRDASAGVAMPDLVKQYEGSGLDRDPQVRRQQLDTIVNGSTHRNAVNDLLNASPLAAGRILGGYVHDMDAHLFTPQVSVLSKALEQTMDAYKDEPSGQVAKAKAAWEAGKAGIQDTIKSLPFDAFWNKGGLKENLQTAGKDVFNGAKMVSDVQNTFNRLQMYELSRFQYQLHLTQNLKQLGITEDQALAQMNNTAVRRNPSTGLWEPVPVDPRLKYAAADAELSTMKNTLRAEPQAGVLGNILSVMRTFNQKVFPSTSFFVTFPRYVANYMLYAASHSPTKLLDLFSSEYRSKIMDVTGDDPVGRQEAIRSLGRGMTGLGLTAIGYAMSQGHSVGGYTMGPKPYLLWDGKSRDEKGNPKYLNVNTIGPVNFYLHLGHLTDAAVNEKPVNLNAEEWQDFLTGARVLDNPVTGLHDTIQALQGDNPESKWQAIGKIPGNWAGRWTRFWRGGQDDAAALGWNVPNREQRTDQYGNAWRGPTLNNVNPAALPARINPFTGKLDIEEHPGQALLKTEARPMYPMEKWMTELNTPTYEVTENLKDATSNNRLRQLTGMYLNDPELSRGVVQEAVGVDLPLDKFIDHVRAAYPMVGKKADANRQMQEAIQKQVLSTLKSQVKEDFLDLEEKRQQAGFPSPVLADEWIKQNDQGLPVERERLNKALKALGIR